MADWGSPPGKVGQRVHEERQSVVSISRPRLLNPHSGARSGLLGVGDALALSRPPQPLPQRRGEELESLRLRFQDRSQLLMVSRWVHPPVPENEVEAIRVLPHGAVEGLRRSRKGQGITDAEKAQILPHYEGSKAAGREIELPDDAPRVRVAQPSPGGEPQSAMAQEISGQRSGELDDVARHQPRGSPPPPSGRARQVCWSPERGKTKLRLPVRPRRPARHGSGLVRLGHGNGGRWMKGIGFNPAE